MKVNTPPYKMWNNGWSFYPELKCESGHPPTPYKMGNDGWSWTLYIEIRCESEHPPL